jgi:hypothetical protein
MASIRSKISDISKGKRIHATIVEIINGRVTASTNGRLYKGLDVIGGPVVVDQKVYIDFSSGTPIVHAYASSSGTSKSTSVRTVTTRIITDQEVADPNSGLNPGDHTHTESQIVDLAFDAQKIKGTPVDAAGATDDKLFLQYDRTIEKYILSDVKVDQLSSESEAYGKVIGSDGIGGASWIDQTGGGGGNLPPAFYVLFKKSFR